MCILDGLIPYSNLINIPFRYLHELISCLNGPYTVEQQVNDFINRMTKRPSIETYCTNTYLSFKIYCMWEFVKILYYTFCVFGNNIWYRASMLSSKQNRTHCTVLKKSVCTANILKKVITFIQIEMIFEFAMQRKCSLQHFLPDLEECMSSVWLPNHCFNKIHSAAK